MKNNQRLDLSFHPKQQQVFDCKKRFRIVVAGRRFGKSWLAINEAILAAIDPANVQQQPVYLIAPTYPAARTIYWRRLHNVAGPIIKASNVNLGVIELINGVEIHVKGADRPDTLRGVGLWLAVIDEYATIKPEVWELIIRPALADTQGRCLFIGTPAGRNHFWALTQEAKLDESGEWAVFEFETADNPHIPSTEIDSAKRTLSSSAFRQEFEASFESGGAGVFQREWIKTAPEPKEGSYYITVDLAGFEDVAKQGNLKTTRLDQTAIAVTKCHDSKWWVADVIYGRWDVKKTAENIVLAAKKYNPVAVGIEKGALKNAVEGYLRDEMHRRNALFHVTPVTHGNKAKTDRVVNALQGRTEHGSITFADAPWLKEMTDQLVQFPSKTAHDDLVDALSYTEQLAQSFVFEGWDDASPWRPTCPITGY